MAVWSSSVVAVVQLAHNQIYYLIVKKSMGIIIIYLRIMFLAIGWSIGVLDWYVLKSKAQAFAYLDALICSVRLAQPN